LRHYSKHLVFDGKSFHFARLLSDAASGGQVIVSHECFCKLEAGAYTRSHFSSTLALLSTV
jgi:hypothetical protein